jgi:tRNA pseudouridine38-40 synthase
MFWALLVEYDGTGLVGWQRQDNGLSVQEVMETAAARLNDGQIPDIVTAGRTDAGVHAAGQVVRIDMPSHYTPRQIRDGLNYHMKPHKIAVLQAIPAPEGWNPRFSAIHRVYRYIILNRAARPTIDRGQVWHVAKPLNEIAMQEAARCLIGQHDFSSFRASSCQAKSPIRTIDKLNVTRNGDRITLDVEGRSFLHHMVRNFAGSLKLVGEGRWPTSQIATILAARNRAAAGPTAEPQGLTLMRVDYPLNLFT